MHDPHGAEATVPRNKRPVNGTLRVPLRTKARFCGRRLYSPAAHSIIFTRVQNDTLRRNSV